MKTNDRLYYLPRKAALGLMSDNDRTYMFRRMMSDLNHEIAGVISGEITAGKSGKARKLKLMADRKGRLIAAANNYSLSLG